MLTVGIPKEIKPAEKRVALTPEHAARLKHRDTKIFVQSGAGELSGFPDGDYERAGAAILNDAKDLYAKAGIILKVKEPLPAEYPLLRKGQILFCFLHLASPEQKPLIRALLQCGVTAIGYETVKRDKRLPILAPMSEIAGGLGALYALYLTTVELGASGPVRYPPGFLRELERLAGTYPEVPFQGSDKKAVIFGGGTAGRAAAGLLLKAGTETVIVEKFKETRARLLEEGLRAVGPEELPEKVLEEAAILMGAAHTPGQRAVKVLDANHLAKIASRKRKILIDIAIDQGGNFPDAHSTTYADPVYRDASGNIRFSVANLPAFCGRRASEALSLAALPYIQSLIEGLPAAASKYPELEAAVNIAGNEIRLAEIKEVYDEEKPTC